MTDTELGQLIAAWLDDRISESDSEVLQQHLRESAEARVTFREFTRLDAALRELVSGDTAIVDLASALPNSASEIRSVSPSRPRNNLSSGWVQWVCAAAILVMIGSVAYRLGRNHIAPPSVPLAGTNTDRTMEGYATLRRGAGIEWSTGAKSYREGDVLPAGVLEFEGGVAEIDFFCGAGVIVEGPAKLQLESDWSVRLINGRLRANVPPAARGFVVKAADSEIVDLGTEFALDVSLENVRVEVVDGEVQLRGGEHDGEHLITGEGRTLMGNEAEQSSLRDLSTMRDVRRRYEFGQQQRFNLWKETSQRLRADERLIAYYPIAESKAERRVPNMAASGRELDGTFVGLVNRAPGRFGAVSSGLEFDRPGARVRTRIDGTFHAFTFACWAKIDSLEHRYNALFMGDGYENGEPHWQIRDDGRLMFSVMVDDTKNVRVTNEFDHQVVQDAGLHHVYFTEPIWDISKSGQWFHLAAVYDPATRQVVQYVNGVPISRETITDKFYVRDLRIGPAEIGNWGQPFRKTPWFSVRNLNGTIDELAIFNAALLGDEIQSLYVQGKPIGY